MTPRSFFNISKGYRDKQQQNQQLSWEQTRAVMFTVHLSTPTGKRRKKISIQEFLPFPWEQEKKVEKVQGDTDVKALFKKWDKVEFNKEY